MAIKQSTSLLEELKQDITYHKKWGSHDFALAQLFVWIGIVSSVAASLHAAQALPIEKKLHAAVLAAVPGAVLVIERTFKFAARAAWHTLYAALLKALFRRLCYEDEAEAKVSPDRSKLEIDMEKTFPLLNSGDNGNDSSQPLDSVPDAGKYRQEKKNGEPSKSDLSPDSTQGPH